MCDKRGADVLSELVKKSYLEGFDDYHMRPLKPTCSLNTNIQEGDSVIFCCRRGEREIELTEMFTDPSFDKVSIKKLNNLEFVILTQYHEKFKNLPIAFSPAHVKGPLAEVLANSGKTQFHCAESEKYAHVTFFFNGGENKPFEGETDVCVPSPKGIPFDLKPELSLPLIVEKVCPEFGKQDFIVVNFANGDVIGHTSNSEAKLKACQAVSEHTKTIVQSAIEAGYVVGITADHGNIETLYNSTGKPHVAHTDNKVAFILIDGQNPSKKFDLKDGSLRDVAPTILDVMDIEKPGDMDGSSLVCNNKFGPNRKFFLLILDGWGLGTSDDNDAIFLSETEYWDYLLKKYSWCKLDASGEYVGLSSGKPGNSEAGHMNLGAGKCVIQDDIRIDKAIEDGEFFKNPTIIKAIEDSKSKGKTLHLITYLTYKSSHGSMNYALEVCRMAKAIGQENVILHIIFDGRSTEPGSAPMLLSELQNKLNEIGVGYIADGIGRGLVLDRDGNYTNVKLGYDMMVN